MAGFMTATASGLSMFILTSGFFVKPLSAEFGWSRGQIAGTSGALLVASLLLPLSGRLADRHGVRWLAGVGGGVFVASYLGFATMGGALWQYFAILAAIALIGGPCTSYYLYARPVVAAFDRARGLALSVALSGVPALTFLLAPLLQQVIVTRGWRAGYLVMATMSLVLALGAVRLLRPARQPSAATPIQTRQADATMEPNGLSFREALADSRFWLLALSMLLVNLPIGGYLTALMPLLSDKGVNGRTAALLGSWYAVMAVVGRVFVGGLLDRLWPPLVGGLALAAPALALLAFLGASGDQVVLLGLGVALFALANGAEVDVMSYLTARFFGLRAYGQLNGLLGGLCGVAGAVGGMVSGYMFDQLGSYDLAMAVGAGLSVLAAVAILASGLLRARRPRAC